MDTKPIKSLVFESYLSKKTIKVMTFRTPQYFGIKNSK
jgi:hypothetical protein